MPCSAVSTTQTTAKAAYVFSAFTTALASLSRDARKAETRLFTRPLSRSMQTNGAHRQLPTNRLLLSDNMPNKPRRNHKRSQRNMLQSGNNRTTPNTRNKRNKYLSEILTSLRVITLKPDDGLFGNMKDPYQRHPNSSNGSVMSYRRDDRMFTENYICIVCPDRSCENLKSRATFHTFPP